MDLFENEPFPREPEDHTAGGVENTQPIRPEYEETPDPAENAHQSFQSMLDGEFYSGEGVGRRESVRDDSAAGQNQSTYRGFGEEFPPRKPRKTQNKRTRPGTRVMKKVLAAVLALAVLVGSCGITALLVNNRWEARAEQIESRFNEQISDLQKQLDRAAAQPGAVVGTSVGGMTPSQVYKNNVQSVVQVNCMVTSTSMFGQSTGTSVGSGFILTENGFIVTNYHVIEGATSVSVSTYLGEEYEATIVGYEASNDVAVLKVEAEGLPAVTIGSSSDLIVGDQVVAIGNALGELTGTMTVGYVSAKDRRVSTDGSNINMIQTDAAINSGNSGGPLFNMEGEVVGITTAKYSGSSSSGASIEGIGFAIPIDDVLSMVEDLVNLGYITGAYLGVGVTDVESAAQYYGVPAGAYVEEVNEGSCAEKAGVVKGDIIVALGEHKVENYTDLKAALRKFKAGDTTTISVYRSGQTEQLPITLDEKPRTEVTGSEQMPGGSTEDWYKYFPFFGGNE